jgi:hypothetical protein
MKVVTLFYRVVSSTYFLSYIFTHLSQITSLLLDMCCCILSDEPTEDSRGRYKTFSGPNQFRVSMMDTLSPFQPSCGFSCCLWFSGQCFPGLCGCTQYLLRRKVLNDSLSNYVCCQGYYDNECFKSGSCGEQECPSLCLCIEAHCCSSCALSASRIYVIEKYDLSSDPCDYRLIRINNCLQILSCFCDLLSIFAEQLRELARIIDCVADVFYICVSGCMTVQVAHEVDYQNNNPVSTPRAVWVPNSLNSSRSNPGEKGSRVANPYPYNDIIPYI